MEPVSKKLASLLYESVHLGLMVLKDIEPFYKGTSPNKFFDYISSGLPVLNNYPGWIADIISKYNLGIVVRPNKPEEFADALIEISKNDSLVREMSKNSRRAAEEFFSRELQTKKIIDIFKNLIKSDVYLEQ